MQAKNQVNVPELQGKYRILESIDVGGYATVYKATAINAEEDKVVAIKRVSSVNVRNKYTNHPCIEVRILQDLGRHPHFPDLQRVLVDKPTGSFSIVMNYFEYTRFGDFNRLMNEHDTIQYIRTLLSCVVELAYCGWIHRDIKPTNFLHNFHTKQFMLIDFGLSQSVTLLHRKHEQEQEFYRRQQQRKRKQSLLAAPSAKRRKIAHNRYKAVHNAQSARRRSDVHQRRTHKKHHDVPREGTPGWRAPEVVLASYYQTSKLDVYNVGLILVCIVLGCNTLSCPESDEQHLLQFIAMYGLETVKDTAEVLHRSCQVRQLMLSDDLLEYTHGSLSVYGFEGNRPCNGKLSFWVKRRIAIEKCRRQNDENKDSGSKATGFHREWSDAVFDLIDALTAFNPFDRLSPQQALQHELFRQNQH